MLSQAKRFLEEKAPKKLRDWYFTWIPSQNTVFSPDRCCLTVSEDKLIFLHARKTGPKAELVYSEIFAYERLQELQGILAEVVQSRGLKGVRTTWILRPEHYQLLQTEALPVAPSEFQAAIRFKIKELIHFPMQDAVIDSFPMPAAKLATSLNTIMLVVARLSVLKPIADQINASGLTLTTVDIQELCFRNLTALFEKDEKSSALIFLREDKSFLIVTSQQQLYFSRYLDVNLKSLRAAQEGPDSQAALDALVNTAALDIQRSFDYYQSQWRLPEPARIFLETQRACPIDMQTLLSQRLNVAVNTIDLSPYFDNRAGLDLKTEGFFLPLLGGILREWEQSYVAAH